MTSNHTSVLSNFKSRWLTRYPASNAWNQNDILEIMAPFEEMMQKPKSVPNDGHSFFGFKSFLTHFINQSNIDLDEFSIVLHFGFEHILSLFEGLLLILELNDSNVFKTFVVSVFLTINGSTESKIPSFIISLSLCLRIYCTRSVLVLSIVSCPVSFSAAVSGFLSDKRKNKLLRESSVQSMLQANIKKSKNSCKSIRSHSEVTSNAVISSLFDSSVDEFITHLSSACSTLVDSCLQILELYLAQWTMIPKLFNILHIYTDTTQNLNFNRIFDAITSALDILSRATDSGKSGCTIIFRHTSIAIVDKENIEADHLSIFFFLSRFCADSVLSSSTSKIL
ncbi:hypothetical protein AGLY_000562 [Aphis glycines]|uniref:Uncharacterized protein n=1 Tax=Aphis glycines TaxID=307491 RepID=A0A6G0U8T4_APHGL|nr:hypothetical protein AGLY_000562 [Aphis glycines]